MKYQQTITQSWIICLTLMTQLRVKGMASSEYIHAPLSAERTCVDWNQRGANKQAMVQLGFKGIGVSTTERMKFHSARWELTKTLLCIISMSLNAKPWTNCKSMIGIWVEVACIALSEKKTVHSDQYNPHNNQSKCNGTSWTPCPLIENHSPTDSQACATQVDYIQWTRIVVRKHVSHVGP
jgi:hypothetical protein